MLLFLKESDCDLLLYLGFQGFILFPCQIWIKKTSNADLRKNNQQFSQMKHKK